jgi:hypothetical protein
MKLPVSVSLRWTVREPIFRGYLAGMSNATLLRLAKCQWFEALQSHPLYWEDEQELKLAREECERRGLVAQFDALEGEARAELRGRGLLPGERWTRDFGTATPGADEAPPGERQDTNARARRS